MTIYGELKFWIIFCIVYTLLGIGLVYWNGVLCDRSLAEIKTKNALRLEELKRSNAENIEEHKELVDRLIKELKIER